MTKQVERYQESQSSKLRQAVIEAVFGGLDAAVARAGGELTGFNVKIDSYETLLVIKADFPGGPMVAFCGAGGLAEALAKATKEANGDRLRWRVDKFRTKKLDKAEG